MRRTPPQVAVFDAYPHVIGGAHVVNRDIVALGRECGAWSATVIQPDEGVASAWMRDQPGDVLITQAPPALLRFGGTWRAHSAHLALSLPAYWLRLARVLRGFDLVHINDMRGVLLAAPAALLARRRIVVHVHDGGSAGAVWKVAARVLMAAGVPVVVPSRRAVTGWSRTDLSGLVELPNSVVPPAPSSEDANPLVVCVARIHPDKGLDVLLAAHRLLLEAGHRHRTVVIGPEAPGFPALAASLREAAAQDPAFQLIGPLRSAGPWLRRAWVYVQPSRKEPFGLAALEASACGVPVVATTVGGLPDVVSDGRTGILVAPDSPRELAAAIGELLLDQERRQTLGTEGRERATSEFSRERFASRLQALYQARIA